ncbi:MAG: hypothetical protein M5U28_03720 [Sandaracinaceae bacterium]|nr:hypothetical protein [Sandaracinaceae bacterium]
MLGPSLLATHLTDARRSELDALAGAGARAVLCPRASLRVELKLPPLGDILAARIAPGLGTDSLAVAPSLDVLEEAAALAARFPSVAPARCSRWPRRARARSACRARASWPRARARGAALRGARGRSAEARARAGRAAAPRAGAPRPRARGEPVSRPRRSSARRHARPRSATRPSTPGSAGGTASCTPRRSWPRSRCARRARRSARSGARASAIPTSPWWIRPAAPAPSWLAALGAEVPRRRARSWGSISIAPRWRPRALLAPAAEAAGWPLRLEVADTLAVRDVLGREERRDATVVVIGNPPWAGKTAGVATDNLAGGVFAGEWLAENYAGKNVAVLHDKSTYGKGVADLTKAVMNENGLTGEDVRGLHCR